MRVRVIAGEPLRADAPKVCEVADAVIGIPVSEVARHARFGAEVREKRGPVQLFTKRPIRLVVRVDNGRGDEVAVVRQRGVALGANETDAEGSLDGACTVVCSICVMLDDLAGC